ncbi:pyruvate, phosphate dikinase [Verrucomicrobiaceae bacterium N1E253]|uniref:Pyruvate, phosphate dikinase n=1 Tax=Oceaniferula marina TaxID=2748318 RepID=A0A851GGU3_9BACT|nr:pyruvate, phosphate dikinase [Oceaniferula marina]NWK57008.1 pyruvate, phosphate dikinase [Oceaniferula marina]
MPKAPRKNAKKAAKKTAKKAVSKTAKNAKRKPAAKKAARKPAAKKVAKKAAKKVTKKVAKKATKKATKKVAKKKAAPKAAKKATKKKAAPKAAKKATRKPAKKATRKTAARRTKKVKNVYFFGGGKADGDGSQKNLLGGKGANLAEMNRIGLPVPAGLTITTEVCTYYYDNAKKYPATLDAEIDANIAKIEKVMGKKFGDLENPLLLSVRSGARESMPGMMDTILNLGINDQVVEALSEKTGNPKFAWDSYRRFLQMYGSVVMGVEAEEGEHHDPYEVILDKAKSNAQVEIDSELSEADLRWVVAEFKQLIKDRSGKDFPEDPREQLMGSVNAVFNSWNNDRAKVYRQKYGIPAEWGTAVNVQAMVFGNTGPESGTGVAFTRDPATGENVFYGEYLIDAQGEDVVAGVRTPKPIANMSKDLPESHKELLEIRKVLEAHFKDVQDIEFTIEEGKLWMLQTRNGKRTGFAAVNIALDMVKEKLITQETAILRIPAEDLSHLLAPIFDAAAEKKATNVGAGLPAGPGAASGQIYFTAEAAVEAAEKGQKVILTRQETSPEDLRGMIAAEGILTTRGGASSHAALVARQMGKVCVCGAHTMDIDYDAKTLTGNGVVLKEGDFLSLNGFVGNVYAGEIESSPSQVIQGLIENKAAAKKSATYTKFVQLMKWADRLRKLDIRTNSDTPDQVKTAVKFGAQGIGLTRTEHMFFEGDRIDAVREMILADSDEGKAKALKKLLPYQKKDFTGIFKALEGRPATIRLLDPPLHEFIGTMTHQQIDELAGKLGVESSFIHSRINALHEENPMLGHRGCRLGIVYPEITKMQATAILEAAVEVKKKGTKVAPEIMVPLVSYAKEFELQKEVIDAAAAEVREKHGLKKNQLRYTVGTMMEIPRACLTADAVAETAEFFSFGTNDLTQTCLGLSRDDSSSFLPAYQEAEVVDTNPFASLDQTGVGQLVETGVAKGRSTNEKLKIGICGEHGGDPESVKFFHRTGLNYVSCSPFRIPVAKLAAAQAVLEERGMARGEVS